MRSEAYQHHGNKLVVSVVTPRLELTQTFPFSKRDGSTDSGKLTPQMQEMKISLLERENYTLSNKTFDNEAGAEKLEQNLKRFEIERRQFEFEKLRFLEEKRELDSLRLARFERYKREIEAKRLGLKPNYDIDNNDYMVARKVVIDCKMSDKFTASGQDSGSDSEPEITVVENVPKAEAMPGDESNVISPSDASGDAIKTPQSTLAESADAAKNHLNGKESISGPENPATDVDGFKEKELALEIVEFDAKNPMKLWPYIKLLLREARQIWIIHKRRHAQEWSRIKAEMIKCLSELTMLMMFWGMGGLFFRYIEGNFETSNKAGVKRVKRDFIDQLWLSSHNLR